MVKIDRVVTRGGDGGETSLGDGTYDAEENGGGSWPDLNRMVGFSS